MNNNLFFFLPISVRKQHLSVPKQQTTLDNQNSLQNEAEDNGKMTEAKETRERNSNKRRQRYNTCSPSDAKLVKKFIHSSTGKKAHVPKQPFRNIENFLPNHHSRPKPSLIRRLDRSFDEITSATRDISLIHTHKTEHFEEKNSVQPQKPAGFTRSPIMVTGTGPNRMFFAEDYALRKVPKGIKDKLSNSDRKNDPIYIPQTYPESRGTELESDMKNTHIETTPLMTFGNTTKCSEKVAENSFYFPSAEIPRKNMRLRPATAPKANLQGIIGLKSNDNSLDYSEILRPSSNYKKNRPVSSSICRSFRQTNGFLNHSFEESRAQTSFNKIVKKLDYSLKGIDPPPQQDTKVNKAVDTFFKQNFYNPQKAKVYFQESMSLRKEIYSIIDSEKCKFERQLFHFQQQKPILAFPQENKSISSRPQSSIHARKVL